MKPNTPAERLYNGIIKENPTFVLMLGMCPTLAITTSATNGIGMGLTTTVILAASNLMISLLRNFIPDRVRMPAFIVVVASFVTVVQRGNRFILGCICFCTSKDDTVNYNQRNIDSKGVIQAWDKSL